MNTADALLIAHLVGVLWMSGGAIALTFVTWGGGASSERAARQLRTRLQRLSVLAGVVPGSLIAVVFGSWLAAELDYSLGGAWLSFSYVLWLIFLGIATGIVSPRARRAELAVDSGAASGGQPSRDGVLALAVIVLDVLLVAFIVLMTTRPGT